MFRTLSIASPLALLLLLALPGRSAPPDPRTAAVTAAAAAYDEAAARHAQGAATAEDVHRWSVRWMESAAPVDRAAPTAHLARMEKLEAAVKAQVAAGTARSADAHAAAWYVADAALRIGR